MPELPEVQTVVDTLRPNVMGRTIAEIDLRRADIVTPAEIDLGHHLISRVVKSIDRRGKRIVFTLDDGNRFYVHLGMTGRLTFEPAAGEKLAHTHLIISFSHDAVNHLRFRDPRRFGGVWWLGQDPSDGTMGPEPLNLRTRTLAMALARTRRAVKNALMDQTVVAGLGNIYVDESLFHARIHPLTVASELTSRQVTDLNRSIKLTLNKAIKHRGSTLRDYFDADGNPGGFQKLHAVYDRAGKDCRRCKTPIERFVLGGRSTHFCPECQRSR